MTIGEIKRDDEPQEPERTSGLMRVAGVTSAQESKILTDVETGYFDKQELNKIEREKTPEETEIINGILSNMSAFVRRYGGVPAPIKIEHIHIIDLNKSTEGQTDSVKTMKGKVSLLGRYSFPDQAVYIAVMPEGDSRDSKLFFAIRVAHELMHFNAFQSADLNLKENTVSERRSGFSVKVKGGEENKHYFEQIHEAMTEELTKRFDKEYFRSIPALGDDIKQRDTSRLENNDKTGVTAYLFAKGKEGVAPYAYPEERKKLKGTIKEILKKNPEQFKSKEDVFNIFAEAYFTGKMMDVARLIEKTFGKGSFRKLGEETKTKKADKKE